MQLNKEEIAFVRQCLSHDWDWRFSEDREEYVFGKSKEEALEKKSAQSETMTRIFDDLNPRNKSLLAYEEVCENYRHQISNQQQGR